MRNLKAVDNSSESNVDIYGRACNLVLGDIYENETLLIKYRVQWVSGDIAYHPTISFLFELLKSDCSPVASWKLDPQTGKYSVTESIGELFKDYRHPTINIKPKEAMSNPDLLNSAFESLWAIFKYDERLQEINGWLENT